MARNTYSKDPYGGTWRWRIGVVGTDELATNLRRLLYSIEDFSPCWPNVIRRIMGLIRANIASKGAVVGHTWAPLNKRYEARKKGLKKAKVKKKNIEKLNELGADLMRAKGKKFTGGLLARTGKLLGSIGVLQQTKKNLRIGTRVKYAPYVNFGVSGHNVPPRPFIFDRDNGLPGGREAAAEEINNYVAKVLSRGSR